MARKKTTSKRSPPKRKKAPPEPESPTWDERLIDDVVSWRREVFGILLLLLAVITLLALAGLTQASWLEWWTNILRQLFGWGAYIVCFIVAAIGLHLILSKVEKPYSVRPQQVIGLEILLVLGLAAAHLTFRFTLADAFLGKGGGLVGWALAEPAVDFFGSLLILLIYGGLLLWAIALLMDIRWDDVTRGLSGLSNQLSGWADAIETEPPETGGEVEPAIDITVTPDQGATTVEPLVSEVAGIGLLEGYRDPRLPPIELLERSDNIGPTPDDIEWKSRRIEQTLEDFGLPAQVTEVRQGPAITQFGVEPGYVDRTGPDGRPKKQKVRVGQIAALQRDLILALQVSRLRIQAPVPGRSVVGIEVPNNDVSVVKLRNVLESPEFTGLDSPLAVGLGAGVSGSTVATDLGTLPHLLVAGTTGSGKSVLLNGFITALVFNNTPEQLKLVLIDPKKVELIRFNSLPHLIGNVEVEADRAVGVLRWLTAEMDRRYELFSQRSARNLATYNRQIDSSTPELKPLPAIVVIIDELADLMTIYPGDVERNLCRLAQMARATGIHLVVATQRPSTDVITGLIKANFPARLSFAVASGVDSRVILDSVGAEQLLGRGDMLYLPPDASGATRIQGVFVSDDEIERVVAHWRVAMPDHVPTAPPWESLIARYALLDETDSLLESAIELAQKNDQISASFLQRRLRLGYPRAARLMEHLYEMGLVEDPKSGGKTRRTLIDESDNPLEDIVSS